MLPNMVVVGVIEVLKCPKSHMGFSCGSTLEEVKGRLSQYVLFEVGRGFQIRFWDDVWCGEIPLKEAFPLLYRIAQ